MMTWRCSPCGINWHPYQAKTGCPQCKGGTVRTNEPASPEAQDRHLDAVRVRDAAYRARIDQAVQAFAVELAALPTAGAR